MKTFVAACGVLAALGAGDASAQVLNLSGEYRCIQVCQFGNVGNPVYITQNGWNLNILNEAGEASRAWIDYPGHIWVERFNAGAIYAPDGLTIQFDRGTIWQRVLEPPPPPPPLRRRG